jgi:hypothetical protein
MLGVRRDSTAPVSLDRFKFVDFVFGETEFRNAPGAQRQPEQDERAERKRDAAM